ncbi:MAG: hypothetical protein ACREID_09315, partial [Planctomycetota bacterium]
PRSLGVGHNVASLVSTARLGGTGCVVPAGAGLVLFTDVAMGAPTAVAMPGAPLLGSLASQEVIVFGPGADLAPATSDDEARRLDAAGASTSFSTVPLWAQGVPPGADAGRAFGVGAGADGTFGTGDEQVIVHSIRALGAAREATSLPASLPAAPLSGTVPFFPLFATWGLVQSPGVNGTFGDVDDRLVLVRY